MAYVVEEMHNRLTGNDPERESSVQMKNQRATI